MHALFTLSLVGGWLFLSGQSLAQAQVAARTQPIVLNESACCASPARIPVTVPPYEYRSTSTMTPSMAESVPTVVYAPVVSSAPSVAPIGSSLVSSTGPVVEYRFYAPVTGNVTAVPALQPTPTSELPRDYVVGRNVIGEPKLFRPGQPVRNFLRYLSL